VKNGCRARRFNAFTKRLVSSLTPAIIEELADRHKLAPYGVSPWLKGTVGGSDDHGGLFIARAYTTTYRSESIADFTAAVRSGESWADGEDGGPLTMAHSMYGIAHCFYKERFDSRRRSSTPFVSALLNRFFNLGTEKSSFVEKVRQFILMNLPESRKTSSLSFEEILDSEARHLLNDADFLQEIRESDHTGRSSR